MKVGDKVLCEGEINMIGEGFCRIAFGRVGASSVTHVRVLNDAITARPVKAPAPAKPAKAHAAD